MSNSISDVSNSIFWDKLYDQNNDKWDIQQPTPVFVEWESSLKLNKKNINICFPGCGIGHDALYFASRGYNVYAVDFSNEAILRLKKKSTKDNISINIIKENFFQLPLNYYNYFDFIVEYTFYCAIDPDMRKDYVKTCYNLLNDNGLLVGLLFPFNVNNNGPPFKVEKNEIEINFTNMFKIKNKKSNINSIQPRKGNEIFFELQKK